MNTNQAQHKALDDALIAHADLLEFGKCNMRLKTDIKPKEAAFQVVLDALALTPFYRAFLITVDVPAIYIAFTTIINKCFSGKETGIDKIHLSRAQILEDKQDAIPQIHKDHHRLFNAKDQSISRRNKMFWHTARDDTMDNSMRCISRHEKTQKADSKASPKQKPVQATKGNRIKTKAKVAKSDTKKQPVHDERQQKIFNADEGTGTILGVPDVPIYASESDKESWGDSDEEDDNEDNVEDDADNNDDNGGSKDHDDDSDDERTKFDRDEILDPNLTNVDQTEHEEENVDERVHTPSDYELTDDEKIHDEENIYKEEEDEVTKELYDDVNVNLGNEDTKMTNADQGPTQSSSVSSDFISIILNLDNPSQADNEIASLMDTTTIPLPPPFFNPLSQQATPTPTPMASEITTSLPALLDFASPSSEAAATLFEFELTKILIDKMEKNKSFDVANYKRELYDALVKSYNTNKDISKSYGKVFSLKRSRDKRDIDRDPSAGSDRGTKRRKSSKDAESSRDSKSMEKKSLSMQQDQEFIMGDNYEQPTDKEATKVDWFKKPERPLTLIPN
uniref:Uncharacterized protein n=1 Tax=Tanacetum cinerariifolium TaxID=118510 RepID=A0A6L2KV97_TANCI|nr:hypothetical protein [Tanacetum cinerariifolium]